jgi:site-specific recombinase XerD
MTVNELWQQYHFQLRVRRRPLSTQRYYQTGALGLVEFLKVRQLPLEANALTVAHLREHLVWLEEYGLKLGGVHARGRALNALFNWAHLEEFIERNPLGMYWGGGQSAYTT